MAACPLCDQIMDATHPRRIATLPETIVMLGENQGCRAWCVAVLKDHVEHLADLSLESQSRIFADVARVAAAIRAVIGPTRINYECLGNQVGHIHWHIIPRHGDDPTPREPVWDWPAAQLRGTMTDADRHALAMSLRGALTRQLPSHTA